MKTDLSLLSFFGPPAGGPSLPKGGDIPGSIDPETDPHKELSFVGLLRGLESTGNGQLDSEVLYPGEMSDAGDLIETEYEEPSSNVEIEDEVKNLVEAKETMITDRLQGLHQNNEVSGNSASPARLKWSEPLSSAAKSEESGSPIIKAAGSSAVTAEAGPSNVFLTSMRPTESNNGASPPLVETVSVTAEAVTDAAVLDGPQETEAFQAPEPSTDRTLRTVVSLPVGDLDPAEIGSDDLEAIDPETDPKPEHTYVTLLEEFKMEGTDGAENRVTPEETEIPDRLPVLQQNSEIIGDSGPHETVRWISALQNTAGPEESGSTNSEATGSPAPPVLAGPSNDMVSSIPPAESSDGETPALVETDLTARTLTDSAAMNEQEDTEAIEVPEAGTDPVPTKPDMTDTATLTESNEPPATTTVERSLSAVPAPRSVNEEVKVGETARNPENETSPPAGPRIDTTGDSEADAPDQEEERPAHSIASHEKGSRGANSEGLSSLTEPARFRIDAPIPRLDLKTGTGTLESKIPSDAIMNGPGEVPVPSMMTTAPPALSGMTTRVPHLPLSESGSAIRNQVGDRIRFLIGTGRTEAEIDLRPPELGRLTIRLQVTDGKVHGIVQVESAQVKEILQAELPKLSAALAESGLDLASFDVSVADEKRGEQEEFLKRHAWKSSYADEGSSGTEQGEAEPVALAAGSGGLVDYLF